MIYHNISEGNKSSHTPYPGKRGILKLSNFHLISSRDYQFKGYHYSCTSNNLLLIPNSIKFLVTIIFLTFKIVSFGQTASQTRTSTPDSNSSTPISHTYNTQLQDYSKLQQSVYQREDRAADARASYIKLIELCNQLGEKIPDSEKAWYDDYTGEICRNVKEAIDAGYYQSSIRLAYDAMSKIRNDKQIIYRIDSYKQYCDEIDFKGSAYRNGNVDKRTYYYWLHQNQYKFNPKFDLQGNITGFTPMSITWLYENIDWSDLYKFVTQNGKNHKTVIGLWDLYFMDSNKSSSLLQEYEVCKFYLAYYIHCLNNRNLDTQDHTNLKTQIAQLKSMLINSDNQPSYETFVKSIQESIINN